MRLHSLAASTGETTYYTDGYRWLIESHYSQFIKQGYLTCVQHRRPDGR
jgi:hypothetical protein